MRREKAGFIINIASILGGRGAVGCANYVAAKAGLIGLTKAAAQELGSFQYSGERRHAGVSSHRDVR